jgi:hypothetical protein
MKIVNVKALHVRNFVSCIKSRQRPIADIESAQVGHTSSCCDQFPALQFTLTTRLAA